MRVAIAIPVAAAHGLSRIIALNRIAHAINRIAVNRIAHGLSRIIAIIAINDPHCAATPEPSYIPRAQPQPLLLTGPHLPNCATAAVLFWLGLNPLNNFLAYALLRPEHGAFSYFPGSPHTWFLSWLLVFQAGQCAQNARRGGGIAADSFSTAAARL